ncbi:alpha/beta hydrolase [Chloroflexota bacterium]
MKIKHIWPVVIIAALLFVASACTSNDDEPNVAVVSGSAAEGVMESMEKEYMHVRTTDKITDIIKHPAFKGFAQFIFPLERGMPNESMTLENVASLLPYHSNVRASEAADAINTMINMIDNGQPVFYDIYSEQEKQDDASREATGLFFFRGEPGTPFAVFCAGGGFSYVGSIHEGYPLAIELSKKGYNAFVVQYRVGSENDACEDLAAAISYIFKNSETLEVSTDSHSLWGGSAGARMVANIGSFGTANFGQEGYPQPATVVMAYTGHSTYTKNDPPTYAVIGKNDGIASPLVMERRIKALQNAGIDAELHVYPDLGHGFGLGIGTSAETWMDGAVQFWEKHMNSNS